MTNATTPDSVASLKAALDTLPSNQRLSQDDCKAVYGLAYHAVAQGHFETAFRYFSLLTLYRPTEPAYLSGLALSYKLLKRYAEALSVYSFLAVTDTGGEPQHTLSIVECLLLLGAYEEARNTLDLVQRFCEESGAHAKAAERAQALASMLQAGVGSA